MPGKFTNPPLLEAVCEFRFKSENWDPTISGALYPELKTEFPKKASVQEGKVEFFFDGKTKKEPQISHSENEFPKFSTEDGSMFVIFKKNMVSIHCTKQYLGWNDFKNKIKFVLEKYKIEANPEKIERIGLRYVNKISVDKTGFIFSDYFKINPSPIQNIIKIEDIDNMQLAIASRDNGNIIQTQFVWLKTNNEKMEFILDIDYLLNAPADDVEADLEVAHNKIEEIFLGSLEQKTTDIFR